MLESEHPLRSAGGREGHVGGGWEQGREAWLFGPAQLEGPCRPEPASGATLGAHWSPRSLPYLPAGQGPSGRRGPVCLPAPSDNTHGSSPRRASLSPPCPVPGPMQ